jgi:3-hydroxyisobutyrate dehydrogenase
MAAAPQSASVGLVGLGNLGLPLASALLGAGWALTVLDTQADRVQACVEGGAAATEPSDLVDCDVLVLVVPDDAAVRSLLEGPGGFLDGGRRGRTVIVHSTVLPETAREVCEVAAGRGVDLLDAPVSGGSERAERGELTVMVGGEAGAVVTQAARTVQVPVPLAGCLAQTVAARVEEHAAKRTGR